jgi:hypothetical protein
MVGSSNASIFFYPFFHVAIHLRRGITEFQHFDENFAHQVFITGLVLCCGDEDFTSLIKGFEPLPPPVFGYDVVLSVNAEDTVVSKSTKHLCPVEMNLNQFVSTR